MKDSGTNSSHHTDVYGQTQAPSVNVTGANDRIAVGVVGLGPCGALNGHLRVIHSNRKTNNATVEAACDVYRKRLARAGEVAGLGDSDLFVDYRNMLERKDIDAVLVATHDSTHAQICLDSMEAGKHIYCQLPLTRYLDEAFRVYDEVMGSNTVFQGGASICSAGGWQKCAELIRDGKIGTPICGQISYCRNNPQGEWNYYFDPDLEVTSIDWERWLGPVKKRIPFSPEHFHRWEKYYAYSCGPMGYLGSRQLSGLVLALGLEFPNRVNCISTRMVHTDRSKPGIPEREVPEHVQVLAEFPSGFVGNLTCSTVNAKNRGLAIRGQKATLEVGGSGEKVALVPEQEFDASVHPEVFEKLQPEDLGVHLKNWFDCIRSGNRPNDSIELAIRVQTIISLAEMSDRLKATCLFDSRTRKITDGTGKQLDPITYGTFENS